MIRKVGMAAGVAGVLAIIMGIGMFLSLPGSDPRLTEIVGGPVYTVPQVQQGIARHPQAWVGRTIRLRAVLLGEPGNWLPPNVPTWGFAASPTVSLIRSLPAAWIPVNTRRPSLLQWLTIAPPPEPPAGFFPLPTTTPQVYDVHLVRNNAWGTGSVSQSVFAEFFWPVAFVG